MFPDSNWWGPGQVGSVAAQAPEEVPFTVTPTGEPIKGARTSRQLYSIPNAFSPTDPNFYGSVRTIDAARDSNSTNSLNALRRATAKMPSTYFNYRRMRADGIVAIGRAVADGLICINQWTYEPAEPSKPAKSKEKSGEPSAPATSSDEVETVAKPETSAEDMAQAVKKMWEGRGVSGKSHEGYTLREFFLAESCRAKDHGNHTLEVAWEEGDDGVAVGEFLPCLPENTRALVYTGTRKFAGVRNWGISGEPVDLEPQYCVRFIYDSEGGDMIGRSRFENFKEWLQIKWDVRDKIRTDLNTAIGNIMQVGYPVGTDKAKTNANEEKAKTINLSLAKGMGVVYPTMSMDDQIKIASAGVDPSKIETWKINRTETGQNNFDGFKVATDLLDQQILFGLLVLPRTVREADHGAKADAEEHTKTSVMMAWGWITYVVGLAQNITDTFLVQRFGAKARGMVVVKAAPIDDASKGVLKGIYTALLSDANLAVKVLDIKNDLLKLQIKTLPDFDQKVLAKQLGAQGVGDDLSRREKMKNAGYQDNEVDKILKDKAGEDAIPDDPDNLGGGRRPTS